MLPAGMFFNYELIIVNPNVAPPNHRIGEMPWSGLYQILCRMHPEQLVRVNVRWYDGERILKSKEVGSGAANKVLTACYLQQISILETNKLD